MPAETCPECGGRGFFRLDVPVDDPRFGRPMRCDNSLHRTEQLARLNGLSQMHADDTRLRLSDIQTAPGNRDMLRACRRMVERPWGWLYLWGETGTAKSLALKALCNHLALKGLIPVVYIKFTRLVDIMRDAFAEQEAHRQHLAGGLLLSDWHGLGYLDRFERLKQIRVLAIEEFDKERLTGFAERFRFDFLDERYEQALRGETITLFAANNGLDALPGSLRSRLADGRFQVVRNEAGDARPTLRR